MYVYKKGEHKYYAKKVNIMGERKSVYLGPSSKTLSNVIQKIKNVYEFEPEGYNQLLLDVLEYIIDTAEESKSQQLRKAVRSLSENMVRLGQKYIKNYEKDKSP